MAEYSQPIRKSPRSGQKIDKAEWGGPEWIASLSRPSDRGALQRGHTERPIRGQENGFWKDGRQEKCGPIRGWAPPPVA